MSKKKTLAATIRNLIVAAGISMLLPLTGYAQVSHVFPNKATGKHLDDASNALDNSDSFAKVNSYGGLAIGLGSYSGNLDLAFDTAIPANQTSYIRMGFNPDILNAILGGGLGGVLADILGTVVLGNHSFEVIASNGSKEVLKVNSKINSSFSSRARMVQNQFGHYMLALKPDQSYNKLSVIDRTNALLLGTLNHTKVYSAFTTSGSDICNQELLTYYDANGGLLTLDALGLARGGVTNAYKAIDKDADSFSEISLGLLAVAGEISQTIQLETPMGAEKQFHVVMQIGNPALLQLGLASDAIRIQALSNGVVVFEKPVNKDFLSLDLLGLLSSNKKARIPFHPNTNFDAVRIVLRSFLDLNLAKTTKIYDVEFTSFQSQLTLQGCGTVDLTQAIPNFDPLNTYEFFDQNGNAVDGNAAKKLTTSGVYQIRGISGNGFCPNDRVTVDVTVLALPTLVVTTPNSALNIGERIELKATSNSVVKWYDQQGVEVTNLKVGPFTEAGSYSFTAIANDGQCESSHTVYINVIDPATCPPLVKRVYATKTSVGSIITGGVSNKGNAVDGDSKTYSTITTGLGLLGIGTTWQNLQWDHTIPAGTPVTIKLGSEYSGLALAGAISVVGTKKNSLGDPIDIGTIKAVDGALLTLLPGQNTFEYTFVPSTLSGVKAYDGIRVSMGALLSVAQNARLYGAYHEATATQVACTGQDIQDVLSGVVDLGIGALTATVGVSDPWNIADRNPNTYATMFAGVNVLAATELTAVFHSPSQVGDSLRIDISKPNALLSLGLIKGMEIQRFLGKTKVGQPIYTDYSLLDLRLLSNGTSRILIAPQDGIYDRVRIRLGGVANVLDFLRVHQITRTANTKIIGSDPSNRIEACQGETISFDINDLCTTYKWYDQETGGKVIQTGNSFTIPADMAPGTYKFYIQAVRYGCENYDRTQVIAVVKEGVPANAVLNVSLNGGQDLDLCTEKGTVTLQATVALGYDNVGYVWYHNNNGTVELVSNATTATLTLNNLAVGTHTYYLALTANGYCETSAADRKKIEFNVRENSTAAGISVSNTTFCLTDVIEVVPTATITNPTFNWYFTNAKLQPILDGAVVNGITYSINAQGKLSVSGLTAGTYTYFVAASNTTVCQNNDGDLKEVILSLSDASTPTTTNTTQAFCITAAPKVADLQANGTNVQWYSSEKGGTALDPTTALLDGVYYAASKVGNCESAVRLKVTVNLADGELATGNATQSFCKVDQPKVSDIVTNQIGVKWYTTLVGGTLLSDQTLLEDQKTYYGVLGGGTSCESSVRLAVTVTVSDVATPTTTQKTQEFCKLSLPKVSDLKATAANIKWYLAPQGGVALNATAALVSGNTYYAVDTLNGCESSARLAVTVIIHDTVSPSTTQTVQTFCSLAAPTVADLKTNETNVLWYTAAAGGSLLPQTTPLASEMTYYGVLSVNGCESTTRLAIKALLKDAAIPTTTSTKQSFCKVNQPKVSDIQTNEVGVKWYTLPQGGTAIAPQTLLVTGTYYGALVQNGCESSSRLEVEVTIDDAATPTTTQVAQSFCKVNNPTIANLKTVESNVIWYTTPKGGTPLAGTTLLVSGSTYFGALEIAGCQSSVRLAIDVMINDEATPTTSQMVQKFCIVAQPKVSDLQTVEKNVVWYNKAVGGTLLPSNTDLLNNTVYYAAIQGVNCESSIRLEVTVLLNDAPSPTTKFTSQTFCKVNQPKVQDIETNESGVIWYQDAVGGAALSGSDVLITGVYYGVLIQNGCESSVRLKVDVKVQDVATPTTENAKQTFCKVTQPTIADLKANQTGVSWYVEEAGGEVLPQDQPLVDGVTYYGSLVANGCESTTRLAVEVTVEDEATPTTAQTVQQFCATSKPTVADLKANESDVIWYATATAGTPLTAKTALTDGGIYYAALKGALCESSMRLEVTVRFFAATFATLEGDFEVCFGETATYTTAAGMSNYLWTVKGGSIVQRGTTSDDSITILWNEQGKQSLRITYTDLNGCTNESVFEAAVNVVICSDLAITKSVDESRPIVDENVVFTVTVKNEGKSDFNDIVIADQLPNGYQFVSYEATSGIYKSTTGEWMIPSLLSNLEATLKITAKVKFEGDYLNIASIISSVPADLNTANNRAEASVEPHCLTIYNEFSPNQDGSNDYFRIDCIEYFQNNSIEIYNRLGSLVFSATNYKNNWDGKSNVSGTLGGKDLSDGTYYYVLDLGNGVVKKGWVYIIR